MKTNRIMKIMLILFIFILLVSLVNGVSYGADAVGTAAAIDAMQGMKGSDVSDDSGVLGPMLNSIIGLIQVAGTGISMVMVTMYGIKYIMASPNDKADVKKQIAPMVIGAIILFASVNLVAMVADVADKTLSEAAS